MKHQSLKTLAQVIDAIDSGLEDLLASVTSQYEDQIILGYHSARYKSELRNKQNGVAYLNLFFERYCNLMGIVQPRAEQVDEVLSLNDQSVESLSVELKKRYVQYHNISIPNFPFKIDKLVEAFDFPEEVEDSFDEIISMREEIGAAVFKPSSKSFKSYFNSATTRFDFTTDDEQSLLDRHTVYATGEQIKEVICLNLLCISLNNLKKPDYSFKELPEIDHRYLSKISVGQLGDSIKLDLDKFSNPDGLPAEIGVNQDPSGGMSVYTSKKWF